MREREPRKRINREPKEGIDYMVNYHAVLGVNPDATSDEVEESYKKKIKLYHPDKYAHLAPEFRAAAEEKTKAFQSARDILTNDEKRLAHTQRLSEWTGPISMDGTPIIDLSRPSPTRFIGDTTAHKEELTAKIKYGHTLTGHNPTIFSLIESQYKGAENPSPDLEAAYREALAQKDLALSVEESTRRADLGLDVSTASATSPNRNYKDTVEKEIASGREAVGKVVESTILMIHSGEIKAIGGTGVKLAEELAVNPEAALEAYTKQAVDRYDEDVIEVAKLAEEREEVIEERLKLFKGEYLTDNQDSNTLLIRVNVNDQKLWFRSQHEDHQLEIDQLSKEDLAEAQKGDFSILSVTHEHGLPIQDALTTAVEKHYEALAERKLQESK